MFVDTLKDMVTWRGFIGWQGATCSSCGSTHNLFCGIPCYICNQCGHCNALSWFGGWQRTHRKPDFGWNRSVLNYMTRRYCRYKHLLA